MDNGLLVIIDDEEDILDLLQYNFANKGFEVKAFTQAMTALEFISSRRPDVILCDWMMPEMDGLSFCRLLKKDRQLSRIPFIMVTCRSEKAAVESAMQEGVSDYIVKPVRIYELIRRVESLLMKYPRQSSLIN